MIRRPPISTRTDTLFPYTTLFRSHLGLVGHLGKEAREPGDGPAGADAADDGVDFVLHLLPDLRPGGGLMGLRIGGVAELVDERSEEHTSELQSLMRISYAVFCLKKKNNTYNNYLQH